MAELFTSEDGFIAAMKEQLDVYTDSTSGSLSVRKDSIEERITSLNDDVDDLQTRLDRMEERLRKQFTSMETTMAQLTGAQSFILNLLSTPTTTA
ncbi:MAG TPA: hypothetical protein DFR83_21280 [Deltaproteobacteria bacterium]|nr:hypothetical protein [Deltaproteobacteria bacterium]